MKSSIIFAVLVTLSWARPQGFSIQHLPFKFFDYLLAAGNNNNNNNNNNNGIIAPTIAPSTTSTVTTASPQYLACLQSCPSTMEYNPICGTDMENYHNNGRLSCAQRCGKNVAALRMGTCAPL